MRINAALVIFMVVLALSISIMLFPSEQDINYMLLMDGDYYSTQPVLARQLEEGDWSLTTVRPLINAYQKSGNTRQAIDLVEKLDARQPNNLETLSLLSEFYQKEFLYSHYLITLEKISNIAKQASLLRKLSQEYAYTNQRDKQIMVLEKLVKGNQASHDEKLLLAQLYALYHRHADIANIPLYQMAMDNQPMTGKTRKLIISLLLDQNQKDKVVSILQHWFSDQEDPSSDLIEIGHWLIMVKQADLIKQTFADNNPLTNHNQQLTRLMIDAEIAMGEHESALTRLHNWHLTEQLPASLYPIYIRLAASTTNEANKKRMAPYIMKLIAKQPVMEKEYIYALEDNADINTLIDYFLTKEKNKPLSQAQEDKLVHYLIKLKKYKLALPRLRRRVFSDNQYALHDYLGLAEKLNKTDEALNYLWDTVQSAPPIAQQHRQIAHKLLEFGKKHQAETLFMRLAEQASFDAPDVQQLFFLWGPRPTLPQIQWTIKRARTATDQEQIKWLKKLIQIGEYQHTLDIIQRTGLVTGLDFQRLWVEAVTLKGDIDIASVSTGNAIDTISDAVALQNLALFMEKKNQHTLALQLWQKIHTLHPRNLAALRYLGLYEYRQAHWQKAIDYLDQYVSKNTAIKTDIEAGYFLAESFRLIGNTVQARAYYEKLLSTVKYADQPVRIRLLQAIMLARVGRLELSLSSFEQLRKKNLHDKNLISNYASILMEQGHYEEAQKILQ